MKKDNTLNAEDIISVDFKEALSTRYLSYALSTITARSLPDVRDGLKPVHRRLIFAMHELHLNPHSSFKKCARVVGDVMGKFHPHGDSAIYGALVRLAQDFSIRYPLIEGQGNFGNIDGDNPAAMRYTESRLTALCLELLGGLETQGVVMRATYDGESEEPLILPALFPNLLANGAMGIAVGMATSIPPHNLEELCQATILLMRSPQSSIKDLLKYIEGPDFPTGGLLIEDQISIEKAYTQGRGSFRLRARYKKEDLKAGMYQLVIYEIPYQVEKSKLVERIADLLFNKKLPFLEDIVDESSEDIRLVLKPKSRSVDPLHLMESLYQQTDLDVKCSLNLNVLDSKGIPRVLNLKETLLEFIEHRHVLLEKETTYRLDKIKSRLHILEGYLNAYQHLDQIIEIIRFEDAPKVKMQELFDLSDLQVESILNMRLRSLQKLQEIEIKKEYEKLTEEEKDLLDILNNKERQKKEIITSLQKIIQKYGKKTPLGARRTHRIDPPEPLDLSCLESIDVEDIVVVCSLKNWLRVLKTAHDIKYKEGDQEHFLFNAQTCDKLLLFSSNGKFYTIHLDKIPKSRSGGAGDPLREWIDLDGKDDVLALFILKPSEEFEVFVVGSDGRGFRVPSQELVAQTRSGKQVFVLSDGVSALGCSRVDGNLVAVIGENRKILIFPIEEVPLLSKGKGVTLQKYQNGTLSDFVIFKKEEGFFWLRHGKVTQETDLSRYLGKRASGGRLAPIGFSRDNRFYKGPKP